MPMTPEQMRQLTIIARVANAIVDAVESVEPMGAPGGVLYAALMHHGCTLEQFEFLMGLLVRAGRLRREGHLYFVVKKTAGE